MTDPHPLLAVFDRIYVINLPHRADRRGEMQDELGRIGLSLDHPAVTLFPASFPPDAGGFPSRGARGCFESHLRVHQAILAEGVQRALVLEDDCSFARGFADDFGRIAPRLAAGGWDMLYSVGPVTPGAGDARLGEGLVQLDPGHLVQTTHFLGFQRGCSAVAADYLAAMAARPGGSPEGGPMHVDGAYCWLRAAHPELRAWATEAPLGLQRASRSDIAELRLHDRMPGLRQLAQMARRVLKR